MTEQKQRETSVNRIRLLKWAAVLWTLSAVLFSLLVASWWLGVLPGPRGYRKILTLLIPCLFWLCAHFFWHEYLAQESRDSVSQ